MILPKIPWENTPSRYPQQTTPTKEEKLLHWTIGALRPFGIFRGAPPCGEKS